METEALTWASALRGSSGHRRTGRRGKRTLPKDGGNLGLGPVLAGPVQGAQVGRSFTLANPLTPAINT
jgi:hypothetical protein